MIFIFGLVHLMRIDVHLFGVGDLVRAKINWHTTSAKIFQKDVVLERFNRYLKGIGLHDETIKLYTGRLGAFLDHSKQDEPPIEAANEYRDMLIDNNFSRTHINLILPKYVFGERLLPRICNPILRFFQANQY